MEEKKKKKQEEEQTQSFESTDITLPLNFELWRCVEQILLPSLANSQNVYKYTYISNSVRHSWLAKAPYNICVYRDVYRE